MNTTLTAAIFRHTNQAADRLYDADAVARVVRQHQNTYPGSWREHRSESMGRLMADVLNSAAKAGETSAERIVALHG